MFKSFSQGFNDSKFPRVAGGFRFRARPIPPAMFIIVTTQVHAHLHPRKWTWNPKIDDLKLVDVFLFKECIFRFHVSYFGGSIPMSTCNMLDFLTATPFWKKRSKQLHPGVFKFCFSGWIPKAFLRGSCAKTVSRNRWTWSHHHWRTNLKIMICVCFF